MERRRNGDITSSNAGRSAILVLATSAFFAIAIHPQSIAFAEDASLGDLPAETHPALAEARRAVRLRDFEGAVRIWREAAHGGVSRAQYRLGAAYRSGRGVPKDVEKAAFWFEKAAQAGDADAQYGLGVLYQSGLGVEQNRERALELIASAARANHAKAKEMLRRMQRSGSMALETAGSRIAAQRGDPRNALTQAIRAGDLESAREALARGAPVNGAPEDTKHWRPLILAIEQGRVELVDLLLEYRADPHLRSRVGEPALILAIRTESRDVVRRLLSAGANPRDRTKSGYSALMEAARIGNAGIANDLLSARADAQEVLSDGTSAADVARRFGFTALSRSLRSAGAPTLAQRDASNRATALRPATDTRSNALVLPPVIEAARRGDVARLRQMRSDGADFDVRDAEGDTALHRAADGGFSDAMAALLDAGLDPNSASTLR